MKHLNVVQQTLVEKGLLQILLEGLQKTLAWKRYRTELSRKLVVLKYLIECFQTHTERLMKLEERDGYMSVVVKKCPHLSNTVNSLRRQHDEFRQETRLIVQDLQRLIPTDQNNLNKAFGRANGLLKEFDSHTKREADVFVESLYRDEGGEG
jgi:hypothetical protein